MVLYFSKIAYSEHKILSLVMRL